MSMTYYKYESMHDQLMSMCLRFKTIELKSDSIRKLKDINPYYHVKKFITKLLLHDICHNEQVA